MKRLIIQELEEWKASALRKPLVLMGARQVGKTFVLKEFARMAYQKFVYLNFEDFPKQRLLFEASLDPKDIIKALALEMEISIEPENTLIILDEIQECPNALNSLKYFKEQANQYHVVAAGSLLGVKLKNTSGFPVGMVNFLDMYPLSFLEFLMATGQERYVGFIHEIKSFEPIPPNLHEKLLEYYKIYLFTGGMPEVVAAYVNQGDFTDTRELQNNIIRAYQLDFSKHAPKEIIMKINQVWESIASQLAKENKKFVYSVIRTGARAKEFENAIQWLKEAGLVHKVYNVQTPKFPLNAYQNFEIFKLYLVDVGLLGAKTHLAAKVIIHGNELFQEFKGSYVENYVAQELARLQCNLNYWTSEGEAEVNYVIQIEDTIYPFEIKSGTSGKKKSLQIYQGKYQPKLSIRASPLNLKHDGNLLNIPFYLLSELPRLLRCREP
jgi:predicted AAA+ superfamily ATPase